MAFVNDGGANRCSGVTLFPWGGGRRSISSLPYRCSCLFVDKAFICPEGVAPRIPPPKIVLYWKTMRCKVKQKWEKKHDLRVRNNMAAGLRWLSGNEHILLLQRTRAQFLVSSSEGSQLRVTLATRDSTLFSSLFRYLCTWALLTHTHTLRYT